MKINVTSFGYFGYFLAKEMNSLNCLGTLYTNLPNNRTKEISKENKRFNSISTLPLVLNKMNFNILAKYTYIPCVELFESWVADNMTSCDIFHSFSGFGLQSHKVAKKNYGALTIVERGSSHISFQNEILKNEYSLWGIKYKDIDPRIINKEINEYDFCHKIIVQSSFAEKTFIEKGISKSKIITLPLGVNLDLFQKVQKIDNKFRVLSMGTLSIRKGSIYLLKALKILNNPNIEFMFNGKISSELNHLIRPFLDIINNVGTRPFSELYKIYSQASIFILPTIEDGFGNVIVEAMACGIPVIATTNCGAADIITDGVDGFIIPIRDINAIVEKILFLYENPLVLEEMSLAALKKAQTTLSTSSHGTRALLEFNESLKNYHLN